MNLVVRPWIGAGSLGHMIAKQRLQFGKYRFRACSPDSSAQEIAIPEIQQRGNGLNFVGQAEIRIVVRVDLDDFHPVRPQGGNLLQHRDKDLTRLAPRSTKRNDDRLIRLQNLRFEIGVTNFDDLRLTRDLVQIIAGMIHGKTEYAAAVPTHDLTRKLFIFSL